MTNRLVLNLSHVAAHPESSSDRAATELPAPVFAHGTFLENIGAHISVNSDDELDYCDEQPMTLEMQQIKDSG